MQAIPQPSVLSPDQVIDDGRDDLTAEQYRDQARQLSQALQLSADYGRKLWDQLDQVRHYLQASLPAPGIDTGGAAPTGPDDHEGWVRWMQVYSDVTSVLAGPQGDHDFGDREAQLEEQARRPGSPGRA